MDAAELPQRPGAAPLVSGPHPHEQVTQRAPEPLQERLVELVAALPGVEVGASFGCVAGSRAFHLAPALARGPLSAFQTGTEFAHIHPSYDGSLHVNLPPDMREATIDAGWAVPDPSSNALLVFGPRDHDDMEVIWMLLQASYHFARGEHAG